jgi:hypothetical protein
MPNDALLTRLRERLPDQFSQDALNGALHVLGQPDNKMRAHQFAASRFAHEAAPALTRFANSSPMPFVNGIKAARERIVARTDDERTEFLHKRGFSKSDTAKLIETVLVEEARKPESIFDFVQGTPVARDKSHQDARLDLESRAKRLLERAT